LNMMQLLPNLQSIMYLDTKVTIPRPQVQSMKRILKTFIQRIALITPARDLVDPGHRYTSTKLRVTNFK
jgi:hypothetical protein